MSDLNVSSNPTPTVSDTTAPAQPVATPQAPASQVATSPAPQAPAIGAPQAPEVEPSWLRSRLNEVRQTATRQAQAQYQQERAQIQVELDRYRQQLHAVVGVTPPQNPEIEQVRNQFGQVFPGLSKMEQQAERIMQFLDRAGDLESQVDHYWGTYGRQTMNNLYGMAEQGLGAPLSQEGKRQLYTSFVGYLQQSPELQERYASDPSIVEDFWRQFSSTFIEPVRRTNAVNTLGRVPQNLPQDTPGGIPRISPVPQPQNLDERANAAWASYNAHRNNNS